MQIDQFSVVEPGRIEVQKADLDEKVQPWEVLVETEYSIVSAGTEGAGFSGLVKQMPFGDAGQYPRGTGYGNLGTALEVGDAVEGWLQATGCCLFPGTRRRSRPMRGGW